MKSALITGISSGIGFHLSQKLAGQGFAVHGVVRNLSKLKESLEQSKTELHKNIFCIEADINDTEKLHTTLQQMDTPDIIINNAGYGLYGAFEELTEDQLRAQFDTNFFSPLRLIRYFLPAMRQRQSGRIITISSILGQLVIPTGSAYCSSKWAIEAASEAIRYEVAPFGIQVCLVEPGLIRTQFKDNMKLAASIDAEKSPYRFLNQLIQAEIKKYGRFATSPEAASESILRLLQKRDLPARHTIGADAVIYSAMKKIIPSSLLDMVQRAYTENLHSRN